MAQNTFIKRKGTRTGGFVNCKCYMANTASLRPGRDRNLATGMLLAHFCRCDVESGKRGMKTAMHGPRRSLKGVNNVFIQITGPGT